MKSPVTLLLSEFVTHDVKRFVLTKPDGFTCEPGQGVELFINLPQWVNEEGRPFTPTSRHQDLVLEFTIKRYTEHHGLTAKLHTLAPGAELLISEPFGTINYAGPGVFLAGGAGITPFISIFRDCVARGIDLRKSTLIFSNKTRADIICEKELRYYFGKGARFTCTREKAAGYEHRRIDHNLLRETIANFNQRFYVCGPPEFVEGLNATLQELGAKPDLLVFEE